MIPYFILIFLPMAYSICAKHGKISIRNEYRSKQTFITIGIFFSVFILLLMLRGKDCGVDLPNYEVYFNTDIKLSYREIFKSYNIEVGFHLFNKLISYISKNFQFYIAVVAVICVVPLWILYAQNTDLPYLCIVVFITVAPFSLYFSGLRQAMAISIVPLAYYFVKQKKWLLFLLSVLLAVFFHQSAFIILFMYPVFWAKFTRKWLWLVIPVIVLVLVLNSRIFTLVIPFMGERYSARYGTVNSTGAYAVILLLIIFSIYTILIPDGEKMDEETFGLRNLLFFSTCLQCFAPVNSVAMRINYYFLILVPITISRIPTRSKHEYCKVAYLSYIVMCLFFVAYYFYGAYTGTDILQIYPYIPFWVN